MGSKIPTFSILTNSFFTCTTSNSIFYTILFIYYSFSLQNKPTHLRQTQTQNLISSTTNHNQQNRSQPSQTTISLRINNKSAKISPKTDHKSTKNSQNFTQNQPQIIHNPQPKPIPVIHQATILTN